MGNSVWRNMPPTSGGSEQDKDMVKLYRQVTQKWGIQNLLQVNGNDEQEDSASQEEDVVATGRTLQL
jgi:hypothetical protein